MSDSQHALLQKLLGFESEYLRRDGDGFNLLGRSPEDLKSMAEMIGNSADIIDNVDGILTALQNAQEKNERDRELSEDRLNRIFKKSSTHPLTGLFNKGAFNEFLGHEILQVHKSNIRSLAVSFIDVDKFKTFNDTKGHDAGDDLLVVSGKRLKNSFQRETDILSHWGGDEFAVIGSGITQDNVTFFSQKLSNIMDNIDPKLDVIVTASVGIITTDNTYKIWSELSNSEKKPSEELIQKAILFLDGKAPEGNFQEELKKVTKTIFNVADAVMYDVKHPNEKPSPGQRSVPKPSEGMR